MKDKFKLEGIVHVFDFDASKGAIVKERMARGETIREISREIPCVEYTRHNMILNNGIKSIASGFVTQAKTDVFKYIVIGRLEGNITVDDYFLTEETIRLPITNVYLEEQTGISVIAETFIGTQEANFEWKELGLIRGGSTTSSTGTFFSKVAVNVTKTNQSAKTVMWEIKFNSGEGL